MQLIEQITDDTLEFGKYVIGNYENSMVQTSNIHFKITIKHTSYVLYKFELDPIRIFLQNHSITN